MVGVMILKGWGQWFAKCCENNWTRQAVMQVIDEYCDKPTIFQYIQN